MTRAHTPRQVWSLVGIASYLLASQSGRPLDATKMRRALQYAFPALLVTHPWGEVCCSTIRTMVGQRGGPAGSATLPGIIKDRCSAVAEPELSAHLYSECVAAAGEPQVIKQGISTTDAGRGELSSAYDVMVKLAQVPPPAPLGLALLRWPF